jgi:hypothetical protein
MEKHRETKAAKEREKRMKARWTVCVWRCLESWVMDGWMGGWIA